MYIYNAVMAIINIQYNIFLGVIYGLLINHCHLFSPLSLLSLYHLNDCTQSSEYHFSHITNAMINAMPITSAIVIYFI